VDAEPVVPATARLGENNSVALPCASLTLDSVKKCCANGGVGVISVLDGLLDRIESRDDNAIWIHRLPREAVLAQARSLQSRDPGELPLHGVPFAVKDNIDVEGLPTTAGCPEFAYTARKTATVVRRLQEAGAILIGKTNMDQFATGLVGARSPYGACRNPFDNNYIAGGSSSGSAVAVATGCVSFALGTDTAGSGRVPAAFNNIVGLKPTRGLLSAAGVVPACQSLDCVSVFSLTADDALQIARIAAGYDESDPYSRPQAKYVSLNSIAPPEKFRFGVPQESQLEFFGDNESRRVFEAAIKHLEDMGGEKTEIDFGPFLKAARLLYEGPWVAERYAAVAEFIATNPGAVLPVIRKILERGMNLSAAEAFLAQHTLMRLRQETRGIMASIDMLVTPTAGTIYTIAEIEAEPIRLNSNLGYCTNFMNLLDMCAVAVPAGFLPSGLPFGVTFAGPTFSESTLCAIAARFHRAVGVELGATGQKISTPEINPHQLPANDDAHVLLCVNGAHMSGLPLNHQLTGRGARLIGKVRTAPAYRLYAFENFDPPRPGIIRQDGGGYSIEAEVWKVPMEHFGSFVAGIPAPLGVGTVELDNGEYVKGFLCEAYAAQRGRDISNLGSWRAYLASL
jgi:allophanate hydrolase